MGAVAHRRRRRRAAVRAVGSRRSVAQPRLVGVRVRVRARLRVRVRVRVRVRIRVRVRARVSPQPRLFGVLGSRAGHVHRPLRQRQVPVGEQREA